MNICNFFIKFYEHQHDYPHVYTRLLTPLRVATRYVANIILPSYLNEMLCKRELSENKRNNLIVSLTSFPLRIDKVWLVIESILRQTLLPEKIILWLSKEQFQDINALPDNLLKLRGDIFEIRLVDGDLRSYKKYIYAFQEYPDSLIVTIDDDLFYSHDMLEKLVKAHEKHPNALICSFAFLFKDKNNNLLPCRQWRQIPYSYTECEDIFFGSGGGTLFQPKLMHPDILNKELFLKLAPMADDVWLNSMARLSGLPIIKIDYGQYLPINLESNVTLTSVNDGDSYNDIQIRNVIDHYKTKKMHIFNVN